MNKETARARISELHRLISEYDYQYHVMDAPIVSDDEYDILYRELENLEVQFPDLLKETSPTQNVISPGNKDFRSSLFKKIKHEFPILSLEKTYNKSDIIRFIDRLMKYLDENTVPSYTVEPKYDGLSLNVFYENGKLVYAATRGNGEVGEDVTANAVTLKSIPQVIGVQNPVYVRGEVVVSRKKFGAFNSENSNAFKNPRNFAAGSLRLKDPDEVRKRPLEFIAYEMHGLNLTLQEQKLEFLKSNGFLVPEIFRIYTDINEMILDCENGFYDIKQISEYEIDGLVVKIREIEFHSLAGRTGKSPRWAFAFKFPAEKVATIIQKIDFQIGKTGIYTPVAKYETVNISGSECSSASLHNFDYIREKDIRIGDHVLIEKAGEIIPQVVSVQKELRNGSEKEIEPPLKCYSCETEIKSTKDGAFYYCPNPECPERKIRIIQYFVGKSGLDIKGFGGAIVEKLYRNDKISDIEDIIYLNAFSFIDVEGFAEKSISLLLDSINDKKKKVELYVFLRSLSIDGVGTGTAKVICEEFNDLVEIMAFAEKENGEEEFLKIDDIGPITAKYLRKYFCDSKNIARLKNLSRAMNIENSLYGPVEDNLFSGLKIVITGSFESYKRSELKDILSKLGAKAQNSVSKKTDIVIVGKEAGSKLEKANTLKIRLMEEEELLEILKDIL